MAAATAPLQSMASMPMMGPHGGGVATGHMAEPPPPVHAGPAFSQTAHMFAAMRAQLAAEMAHSGNLVQPPPREPTAFPGRPSDVRLPAEMLCMAPGLEPPANAVPPMAAPLSSVLLSALTAELLRAQQAAGGGSQAASVSSASSAADWGSVPGGSVPGGNPLCHNENTLRAFLQRLRGTDPRLVFVVRRINQLGFRSRTILERHFSRYGEVVEVMVAHSKVKSGREAKQPRTRPGNFGLIVMRDLEAVRAIFAVGPEQMVSDVLIQMHAFDWLRMDEEEQGDSQSRCARESISSGSSGDGHGNTARSVGDWRRARSAADASADLGRMLGQLLPALSAGLPPSPLELIKEDEGRHAEGACPMANAAQSLKPNTASSDHVPQAPPCVLPPYPFPFQPDAFYHCPPLHPEVPGVPPMLPGAQAMLPGAAVWVAPPGTCVAPPPLQSMEAMWSLGACGRMPAAPQPAAQAPCSAEHALPGQQTVFWPPGAGPAVPAAQRCAAEAQRLEKAMHVVALAQWAQQLQQTLKNFEDRCNESLGEVWSDGLMPQMLESLTPQGLLEAPLPGAAPQSDAPQRVTQAAAAGKPCPQGQPRKPSSQSTGGASRSPASSTGTDSPPGEHSGGCRSVSSQGASTKASGSSGKLNTKSSRSDSSSKGIAIQEWAAQEWAAKQTSPDPQNLADPLLDGTLRSHLTEVLDEDPECIFVVRRINKLGFRSREILNQHYSHYGEVVKVLVAHSKVKPGRDLRGHRTKPGGLGLVVMRSPESVRQILAPGEKQRIAGHEIELHRFERPRIDNDASSNGSAGGSAGSAGNAHSGTTNGSRSVGSGRDGDVGSSDTSNETPSTFGRDGEGSSNHGSDGPSSSP